MPSEKLKKYLDSERVNYQVAEHPPAYTAQEIAGVAHVAGKELAKTVMVKIDGELAMVVMPATEHLAVERLQQHLGAKHVEIAREQEFKDAFPDCEVGAMPPFGNLYGMKVFVTPALREDEEIAFNAGSHKELIRMAYSDYERLVRPVAIAA